MFQKLTIVGTILSLFDFVKNCYHLKNIPALRAKGLHTGELNTRARSALVISGKNTRCTHCFAELFIVVGIVMVVY